MSSTVIRHSSPSRSSNSASLTIRYDLGDEASPAKSTLEHKESGQLQLFSNSRKSFPPPTLPDADPASQPNSSSVPSSASLSPAIQASESPEAHASQFHSGNETSALKAAEQCAPEPERPSLSSASSPLRSASPANAPSDKYILCLVVVICCM